MNLKISSASRNHRFLHSSGAGLCLPKYRCQKTSASPSRRSRDQSNWAAQHCWGSPAVLLPNEPVAGEGRLQDSKDRGFAHLAMSQWPLGGFAHLAVSQWPFAPSPGRPRPCPHPGAGAGSSVLRLQQVAAGPQSEVSSVNSFFFPPCLF